MYLVTNNLELSSDDFETLYKKRWSVEEYHKSIKQNASAKNPLLALNVHNKTIYWYRRLGRIQFVSLRHGKRKLSRIELNSIHKVFRK